MTESRKSLRRKAGTIREPIEANGSPDRFPAGQEPPKGVPPALDGIQPATTQTDAERYAVAMTDAATTWITAHPELYRRMVDGTMGQYRGQPGEFALRMAGLMRACADAAGFPSLAIWLERAA